MKDNFVKRIEKKIRSIEKFATVNAHEVEDVLVASIAISAYEDALSIYQEEKNGGVKDGSKA